jgi:alpha-soluble NSF attachment protein
MSTLAKAQKAKGDGFMLEAKKTLNKSAWFSSSKERKFEDAAELYEQAANAFKVGGFHQEAGDAYTEAAKLYRDSLGNMNDASKCLSKAGMFCL